MIAATEGKMIVSANTQSWLLNCSNHVHDRMLFLVAADALDEEGPELESCAKLLRWLGAKDEDFRLLFTGSRKYGHPKSDSDFDWCVLLNQNPRQDDLWELRKFCDDDTHNKHKLDYYGAAGIDTAMRFGPVNLLCLTWTNQFEAWNMGTANLTTIAPVTREMAVDEFQRQFRNYNVDRNGRFERGFMPRCSDCNRTQMECQCSDEYEDAYPPSIGRRSRRDGRITGVDRGGPSHSDDNR